MELQFNIFFYVLSSTFYIFETSFSQPDKSVNPLSIRKLTVKRFRNGRAFFCALCICTPFRSAQNHYPPDNVRMCAPPEAVSDGGSAPTTDTDLLPATYRGGSHFPIWCIWYRLQVQCQLYCPCACTMAEEKPWNTLLMLRTQTSSLCWEGKYAAQ